MDKNQKETVNIGVNTFKKLSEITAEERKALPLFSVTFNKDQRKGAVTPTFSVIIHLGYINPRLFLTEAKYTKVMLALKQLSIPKSLDAKCRIQLSKGLRKDGSSYYMVEAILGPGMIESVFFDNDQVDLLLDNPDTAKLFVDRPEKEIDATTTLIEG